MKLIKKIICNILSFACLPQFFSYVNKKKFVIVMYHGITLDKLRFPCWWQLHVDSFEEQIKYLSANYNIIFFSELLDKLKQKEVLPEKTAIISFDDGYLNNFDIALPILKKYNVPSTIFLTTKFLSNANTFWPDKLYCMVFYSVLSEISLEKYGYKKLLLSSNVEKMQTFNLLLNHLKVLSEDERASMFSFLEKEMPYNLPVKIKNIFNLMNIDDLKKISKSPFIELAVHGKNHTILTQLENKEVIEDEIEGCYKLLIENGLKIEKIFAYPNGNMNNMCVDILKSNNFNAAVTTTRGLNFINSPMYDLKRISVGADLSFSQFKLLVSGVCGS